MFGIGSYSPYSPIYNPYSSPFGMGMGMGMGMGCATPMLQPNETAAESPTTFGGRSKSDTSAKIFGIGALAIALGAIITHGRVLKSTETVAKEGFWARRATRKAANRLIKAENNAKQEALRLEAQKAKAEADALRKQKEAEEKLAKEKARAEYRANRRPLIYRLLGKGKNKEIATETKTGLETLSKKEEKELRKEITKAEENATKEAKEVVQKEAKATNTNEVKPTIEELKKTPSGYNDPKTGKPISQYDIEKYGIGIACPEREFKKNIKEISVPAEKTPEIASKPEKISFVKRIINRLLGKNKTTIDETKLSTPETTAPKDIKVEEKQKVVINSQKEVVKPETTSNQTKVKTFMQTVEENYNKGTSVLNKQPESEETKTSFIQRVYKSFINNFSNLFSANKKVSEQSKKINYASYGQE